MKLLLPAFLLLFAAMPAKAQVYGADDDPYSQNPFASNMTVPDPTPAATPASQPAQPAQPQPDSVKPPQTTAATTPAAVPQKPAQP